MWRALTLLALALSLCLARSAESIDVYFSPNGGATDAIVRALQSARSEIRVLAYSFTSTNIASALRAAQRRGVNVAVVLDDSNQTDKYSGATFLSNAGIRILIDSRHGITHSKYMVVDRTVVITGSFNFSKAAEERNAENLLVIREREVAAKYLQDRSRHASHAAAYKQPRR